MAVQADRFLAPDLAAVVAPEVSSSHTGSNGKGRHIPRIGRRDGPGVGRVADLYADQNELDYAALDAAVKTGRVKAETGL